MAVFFIRKPSETPNIQNIDDIRMVRYAYGNQNGYIKNYGQELSHTIVGSTFSINSGIFVIQGAEVRIDANGWSESVSGVTNKRYYIVYGEVDLDKQTAEIKSKYSYANYPTEEASDDLTEVTNGTASVLLYRFTATNGIIADVVKVIKGIDYYTSLITSAINQEQQARENAIEQEQQARQQAITTERNARISAISAESNARQQQVNTINSRLDSLGFRQGSVSLASGTATVNIVKRTGNYVIGQVTATSSTQTSNNVLFTLPTNFRPKTQYSFLMGVVSTGQGKDFNDCVTATVRTNGEFYISGTLRGYTIKSYNVNFGFEASPL